MAEAHFDWLLSFAISFATCVLLFSLAKTVKIYYTATKTRNNLTLLPHFCLLIYLTSKIIQKSVYLSYWQQQQQGNEITIFT